MRLDSSVLKALTVAAASVASLDMRLITYNIRTAVTSPGTGEELWSVRQPLISAQLNDEISEYPQSLLCFQEALSNQVDDLNSGLEEWTYYGVGRDDGARGGEFSPIFYNPSVWTIEENSTYWLSETPQKVGSKGWDAALPRIVTVARFVHEVSSQRIVYMCTHFDHIGQTARVNSAKLIVNLTDDWSSYDGKSVPVFVGGDLNIEPDNEAYKILASELHDTKYEVPADRRSGYNDTYTAFTNDGSDDLDLDHIFVKDASGLEWDSYAVLDNKASDGVFISDHRAVELDFKISA